MKKELLFWWVMLLIPMSLRAQVIVENININEVEDIRVCELLATQKFLSRKVVITINYGQNIVWGAEGSRVLGEDGKMRTFNSVMHAINFMEKNGWEFINAFVVTVADQNVYHYYFRKRPKEPEPEKNIDNQ